MDPKGSEETLRYNRHIDYFGCEMVSWKYKTDKTYQSVHFKYVQFNSLICLLKINNAEMTS